MTSKEVRQSFLDFFAEKGHRIVPSNPVIPHGDPTLLFTNAGMNQFKDVFLGTGKRDYTRVADTQKCIRVSGKHNDLEEVGVDTFHHTFFEMLGNWSFGDYYKKEAIAWAWELLTEVWKLDKNRLHATVYKTDDEAYELWKQFLPESRIHRFDEKDNFWEMGESGPCGPCSEIHYDRTSDLSGGKLVNSGSPDVIEIWNLVFIQFNRKINGTLEELSSKHVDTGMGFERICAVINKKVSNYDTDVFTPLLNKIEKLSGHKYSKELNNPNGIAMRVIADHIRTLSFAIADGAFPGNEGRGYVLRRILRRASRFARNLGFKEPMLYLLLDTLIEIMGDVFPELITQKNIIKKVIKAEEDSFLQTLDRGLEIFDNISNRLKNENAKIISGADAFQLYDTFGFPLDLTELIARENNLVVDTKEFENLMNQQKERSRSSRKIQAQEAVLPNVEFKSEFLGYDYFSTESKVLWFEGNQIILDKTPFYVESGGQISDIGTITLEGYIYNVIDIRKSGDAIIHFCDSEIDTATGAVALAEVDSSRRRSIMRNHSATHLLHEALRTILGNHLQQAGSAVHPDYLRFDFNHFEKVSESDLKKIEAIVNEKIFENIDVQTKVLSLEEAGKNGNIKMFFGDKYGDIVRVVIMDDKYSMELCGGTHVKNTSEIGIFKIISESSIAAGVRRIEACTGSSVLNFIDNLNLKIDELQQNSESVLEKVKHLEKEISHFKILELKQQYSDWVAKSDELDGIKIIAKEITIDDIDNLRTIGENLRDFMGSKGIALIASIINEKIQMVCVVTDDLKSKLPAGKIVGEAAKQLGGGGGGKSHLATAGGKDIEKLPALISGFSDIIKRLSV
ncbi:MAG: alanine--tRNA ligase [Bacteroidota bacterium]